MLFIVLLRHLWEAEECYLVSFEDFYHAHLAHARHTLIEDQDQSQSTDTDSGDTAQAHTAHHENHNRTEIAWAMAGVSAGHKQWQRLAGLGRSGKFNDLKSILQFKSNRKPLIAVRLKLLIKHIAQIAFCNLKK